MTKLPTATECVNRSKSSHQNSQRRPGAETRATPVGVCNPSFG